MLTVYDIRRQVRVASRLGTCKAAEHHSQRFIHDIERVFSSTVHEIPESRLSWIGLNCFLEQCGGVVEGRRSNNLAK